MINLELGPKNPNRFELFDLPYQSGFFDEEDSNTCSVGLPVLKDKKELVKELDIDLKNIKEKSKYSHTLTNLDITDNGNLTLSIGSDSPQDFYHRITQKYNIVSSEIKTND